MWPSNTSGAVAPAITEVATNLQDYYSIAFDAATNTYAQANLMMPTDYDGGTVTATFVWTATTSAATGAVTWAAQWNQYGDNKNLDATWGTAQEVTDTYVNATTGSFNYISSATAAITPGGTTGAASQLALFRIYRRGANTADTLTTSAQLIGAMIAYTRT